MYFTSPAGQSLGLGQGESGRSNIYIFSRSDCNPLCNSTQLPGGTRPMLGNLTATDFTLWQLDGEIFVKALSESYPFANGQIENHLDRAISH